MNGSITLMFHWTRGVAMMILCTLGMTAVMYDFRISSAWAVGLTSMVTKCRASEKIARAQALKRASARMHMGLKP